MKWIILFIVFISLNFNLYSLDDSIKTYKPESYIAGFYNWDNDYNLYGLKLGISIPTYKPNFLNLIFELSGGLGKLNDKNLWGLVVMPGLQLNFNKGITFLSFDVLTGFGSYYYDGKNKGIFGNQTEFRCNFGVSPISIGFYVNVFTGDGMAFSGKGMMLSWEF